MKYIVLVHGIGGAWGLKDSRVTTTSILAEKIRADHGKDVKVFEFKYGPRGWFTAEKFSKYDAINLRDFLLDISARENIPVSDIDMVGHSNGCKVIWKLMQTFKAALGGIIWLNPALDSNVGLRKHPFKSLSIVTNKWDKANWIGAVIPFHKFGLGGVVGFCDKDKRIKIVKINKWSPFSNNHNYLFKPKHLQIVTDLVISTLVTK